MARDVAISIPGKPFRRDIAVLLFFTLLGSYAYFWQARCWNSASRLMLTYALGDRATVSIDGLEQQTRDRAFHDGHYFCDKPPGQSFLGVPFYLSAKLAGAAHPLDQPPLAYWWPDYLLTVGTSGLLSALLGILLYWTALSLGCGQLPAAIVALGYGLGTPAWTYATLFYGHQTAAFCAFLSFVILRRNESSDRWSDRSMFAAGLSAGYAVIAEYPMLLVSLGITAYAYWGCRRFRTVLPLCLGGALCAVLLGIYHTIAFGGPLELGYFNETEAPFQEIYSVSNPIGLKLPSFSTAVEILFSTHGLFLFAPITLAAVPGCGLLAAKKKWKLLFIVLWSFGSNFLINASHPTWTGGYATGPRYVLPGIPFLMIAVAATVAGGRQWPCWLVGMLGLFGVIIVGSCTAYGGRLPDLGVPGGDNPLIESVFPAWQQGHFDRNLGKLLLKPLSPTIPPAWKWLVLVPLLVYIISMVALLVRRCLKEQPPNMERTSG